MNYLSALNFGTNLLKKTKIKSHSLDAELLLAYVSKFSREKLLINLNKKIKEKILYNYKLNLKRRKKNEPIAYILKKKEFWRYSFYVNKNVLIPRPETEIIVEELLKKISFESSKKLLDVGTGSGCIIISIIKDRPKCYASAIDISKKAINIAKINAKMHHLENKIKFINIDIDKLNHNKYDFIVSNPPYICNFDLKRLDNDIRLYEPMLALKAGLDGLSEIKKLITKSKYLLKHNGKLIFEIGFDQVNDVKRLLFNNNFYLNKVCKDLQNLPRVIISTKQF